MICFARIDNANHLCPEDEESLHTAPDCACGPTPHLRISDRTGEARWTWVHHPFTAG